MNNFIETQTTPTFGSTVALAMGAVIMGGQFHYPAPVDAYKVEQVTSTSSSSTEGIQLAGSTSEVLAKEIASIYASFAMRQEKLTEDFEAAIFDDLEGLYEA